MRLWTVDAFTKERFRGNPAAVALLTKNETKISDEKFIKIASEVNLSETAFIRPYDKGDKNEYEIRWFTPITEVNLCGHATLSAAHILFSESIISVDEVIFHSKSGPLTVKKEKRNEEGNYYTLDFPIQPVTEVLHLHEFFANIFTDCKILNTVLALDVMVVEVENVDQVKNTKVKLSKIEQIKGARGVIITALDKEGKYDFVSRYFAPKIGIPEDPVTGSAHCKLVDYWGKKMQNKTIFRAYQASPRGGELELEIGGASNERVLISGSAVTMISGNISID